jgi:DNA repair protein RecO
VPLVVEEAIVLARYPFKERSAVVALLTRGRGAVRAVARRAQGRGGGALEPLSQVTVTLFTSPRRELATVDEVAVRRSFLELAQRPLAWAAALVSAELALELCPPGTVQEGFYRLLEKMPVWLEGGVDPGQAVLYGQLWAAKLAGVLPDPTTCAACGLALRGGAAYVAGSGFCCPEHGGAGVVLGPATVAFVHQALRNPLDRVAATPGEELSRVLEALFRQFLEKELRSLQVFRALREALPRGW